MTIKNKQAQKFIQEMLMIECSNAFFISVETVAQKFFNMSSTLFIKKLKNDEIKYLEKSELNDDELPIRNIMKWLEQHRAIAFQNLQHNNESRNAL